jgi:hypothetical protein
VTESIHFSIYESGKEPDGSGRIISQGVTLEQARADLNEAVQEALPQGDKGVQLIVPGDLQLSANGLPGCSIKTTQEHPEYGLLECDGVPTGTRYVVEFSSGILSYEGQIVPLDMVEILDYEPSLKGRGEYVHTIAEAHEAALHTVQRIFAMARAGNSPDPFVMILGDNKFLVPGCSVDTQGLYPGLIRCPKTESTSG